MFSGDLFANAIRHYVRFCRRHIRRSDTWKRQIPRRLHHTLLRLRLVDSWMDRLPSYNVCVRVIALMLICRVVLRVAAKFAVFRGCLVFSAARQWRLCLLVRYHIWFTYTGSFIALKIDHNCYWICQTCLTSIDGSALENPWTLHASNCHKPSSKRTPRKICQIQTVICRESKRHLNISAQKYRLIYVTML